jgi:hypothetical protein
MLPTFCFAQVEQKSVLQSDVSHRYKQAVREGFYKELNNASGLEEGYHGFVDFGYTLGVGDYEFGRFEINTTHGYQFNSHLFVGGGLGFHLMSEYDTPDMNIALDHRKKQLDIPVYGDVRWTIINQKVTPFIDGKIGYYVTNRGGLYGNLAVGCRVSLYNGHGINFSIGYSHEKLEFETFDHFKSQYSMDYRRSKRKLATEGISFKIGYDF